MTMIIEVISGTKIELKKDWTQTDKTLARGSGFYEGDLLDSHEIAQLFSGLSALSKAKATLQKINGYFSIIAEVNDGVLAIVDRVASYPLFYTSIDPHYISDDPSHLRDKINETEFDRTSELEYLLCGYVTGRNTLSPSVKQIPSGEILFKSARENERGLSHQKWFEFPTQVGAADFDENEQLQRLDEVLNNTYRRLIKYANGRPIVVSLSGGYDSRLSLIMLNKLGYDNLIALTHEDGEGESRLCKKIVQQIGVPWVLIPEKHESWGHWYNSYEYTDFRDRSRYLDRIPTIEGALAIRTAKKQKLVPDDSIFVTGDGPISTGEHIPPRIVNRGSVSPEELIDTIIYSHYKYWEWDKEIKKILDDQVRNGLNTHSLDSLDNAIAALEYWDWQERQSKFIPRKHIFEFWGYDWWKPLWDAEFIEFWSKLPLELKVDKKLFRRYVSEQYSKAIGEDSRDSIGNFWKGKEIREKLAVAVKNTNLDPRGTRFGKPSKKVYRKYINPIRYEDNAMFGIMEEDHFYEIQKPLLGIIHAYQVLDILDRVSFDPPRTIAVPENSKLSFGDIEN